MAKQAFRKASLEKHSSPDQLDVMMEVTSPLGWLSLLSMGMLLVMAVLWGIFGTVTTSVTGKGILIRSGGIVNIESPSSGQVTTIYVKVGDNVSKGQLAARIAQPKLLSDINVGKANLKSLKAEYERSALYNAEELKVKLDHYAKQRADHEYSLRVAREHLEWAEDRLKREEGLLNNDRIKREEVFRTKKEIHGINELIEKTRRDLNLVSIEEMNFRRKQEMDLTVRKREIEKLELQIDSDMEDYELKTEVASPHTGIVMEMHVQEGAMLNSGQIIMTLELTGEAIKDLVAVLYIAAGDGKRVRNGMHVQISPSTVKKEEWGSMVGLVTYVSELPASAKGMLRILQNQNLVESFHAYSAPIEIYADLIPDPSTKSGYKWSSPKGPPASVDHGTLCSAQITVEEQPPISLVIPLLKKYAFDIGP